MNGLPLALWIVGLASLTISVLWHPARDSHDEIIARRTAMLGFLYVCLAALLSIQ